MTSLLNRLFGRRKQGSGLTAKSRLHFVLQHDRINLPPERMDEMKREILAVIVKYLVIDEDRVEIALEQRDRRESKLVAEVPFTAGQSPAPPRVKAAPARAAAETNGADAKAAAAPAQSDAPDSEDDDPAASQDDDKQKS